MVPYSSPAIVRTEFRTTKAESASLRENYGVRLYSEFPNLFYLALRKAVTDTFLSFDDHALCSVVGEFCIDRFTRVPGQQINFSILSVYADGPAASAAVTRARRVTWPSEVVRDLTGE